MSERHFIWVERHFIQYIHTIHTCRKTTSKSRGTGEKSKSKSKSKAGGRPPTIVPLSHARLAKPAKPVVDVEIGSPSQVGLTSRRAPMAPRENSRGPDDNSNNSGDGSGNSGNVSATDGNGNFSSRNGRGRTRSRSRSRTKKSSSSSSSSSGRKKQPRGGVNGDGDGGGYRNSHTPPPAFVQLGGAGTAKITVAVTAADKGKSNGLGSSSVEFGSKMGTVALPLSRPATQGKVFYEIQVEKMGRKAIPQFGWVTPNFRDSDGDDNGDGDGDGDDDGDNAGTTTTERSSSRNRNRKRSSSATRTRRSRSRSVSVASSGDENESGPEVEVVVTTTTNDGGKRKKSGSKSRPGSSSRGSRSGSGSGSGSRKANGKKDKLSKRKKRSNTRPPSGVGADENSWAIDVRKSKKYHNGVVEDLGGCVRVRVGMGVFALFGCLFVCSFVCFELNMSLMQCECEALTTAQCSPSDSGSDFYLIDR